MQAPAGQSQELLLRVVEVGPHQRLTLVPVEIDYSIDGGVTWTRSHSDVDFTDTIAFFDHLEERTVDGKTFPHLFQHEGVSLWHFLPAYLFPELHRGIGLAKSVEAIVTDTKPERVAILLAHDTASHLWSGAVAAVAAHHSLPLRAVSTARASRRGSLRASLRGTRLGGWIRSMMDTCFDIVAGAVTTRKERGKTGGKKVLFGTYPRMWTASAMGGKFDEQFSPLIESFNRSGWDRIVGVEINYAPRRRDAIDSFRSRIKQERRVRWVSFPMSRPKSVERNVRHLMKVRWEELREDGAFKAAFDRDGMNLWPVARPLMEKAFRDLLPGVVRLLHAARRIIGTEQPDAVVVSYETGPWQRALIVEAARAGIPSGALQHGVVFEKSYEEMPRRLTTRPFETLDAYPIPTVSCVWGPLFGRTYTEIGNYPKHAVAVTGHWRYDWLLSMVSKLDRSEVRRSLGLDDNRRVVLILSSDQETPFYVASCVDALDHRTDVQLIVKPHPSEAHDPIKAVMRERGISDQLLEGRLVEAFLAADLVVSQPSTLLSEAVLFDRPTVFANLQHGDRNRLSGWERYSDSGAFLYVTDPSELRNAFDQLLDDPGARERLREVRTEFVHEYFGPLDGRSGDRVVEAVERAINSVSSTN